MSDTFCRLCYCTLCCGVVAGCLLCPIVFAGNAQLSESLTQIVNQLNMLLPMIDNAEALQSKQARYQFTFNGYHDVFGHYHAGLRQDVLSIRKNILLGMNSINEQPNVIHEPSTMSMEKQDG